MNIRYKLTLRAVFAGLVVFLLLVFAVDLYSKYSRGQWEKDVRNELLKTLISKKSNLEKALYSRIYYTKGVAAFVSLKPNVSNDEFIKMAHDFLIGDTVISTMSLSKNCIINAIYPLEGHKAALGLNLMAHPKRVEIVEKTIETRQTFVAGPVELVEGGWAFVSYTPIFDKTASDSAFWGMTDIVIYRDKLFHEANLNSVENGFKFALKGIDGRGDAGGVFMGDTVVFEQNPVVITINLPYGSWILAAIPHNGWQAYFDQDTFLVKMLMLSSLIISSLVGLLIFNWLRLKRSENELRAIFRSMDSFVAEFDANGKYLKVVTSKESFAYRTSNELIGKTVSEVLPADVSKIILDAINTCIAQSQVVDIEYMLNINNMDTWFAARISKKSGESVILNAVDITIRKHYEEEIVKSNKKLEELNAMKDRFMSIIAHDLRNPVGSSKELIGLLIRDFDDYDAQEILRLMKIIDKSTTDVNDLLESILKWYFSQKGMLSVNFETQNLYEIAQETTEIVALHAEQKGVRIINEIDGNVQAYFDKEMTNTVLRNLVTNALKFSDEGSIIKLSAQRIAVHEKLFVQVNVSDTGQGMDADTVNQLFLFTKLSTSIGTKNEKGSGIGLVLCKDFVEKQGGSILVKSEPGKGSVFSFTLPIA